MPAYNASNYIEAITSVIAQTFTSWELIIVDDGSVDATAKIALEWVTKINEFNITIAEWQTRQNQKFRNLKIKGVYLAFLDADDLWLLEN
jgi:glycosyltransferase involved in cell wall biosynthesis